MFEAFTVVAAAAILGMLVGLVTATIIAEQFYMFLELPVQVFVPWTLLIIMMIISVLTTWFAVVIPVGQVNKR
jgi:ABC-type antimicrobial peptide transport system permease subunit